MSRSLRPSQQSMNRTPISSQFTNIAQWRRKIKILSKLSINRIPQKMCEYRSQVEPNSTTIPCTVSPKISKSLSTLNTRSVLSRSTLKWLSARSFVKRRRSNLDSDVRVIFHQICLTNTVKSKKKTRPIYIGSLAK